MQDLNVYVFEYETNGQKKLFSHVGRSEQEIHEMLIKHEEAVVNQKIELARTMGIPTVSHVATFKMVFVIPLSQILDRATNLMNSLPSTGWQGTVEMFEKTRIDHEPCEPQERKKTELKYSVPVPTLEQFVSNMSLIADRYITDKRDQKLLKNIIERVKNKNRFFRVEKEGHQTKKI